MSERSDMDLYKDARFLMQLSQRIRERIHADANADAQSRSYVHRLLQGGQHAVLKKIGEEATEVILAACHETSERQTAEAADLLFHLLVLLEMQDLGLEAVVEELRQRYIQSNQPQE